MGITAQQKTIKPGYKQTEVGVLPGDWNLDKLGSVCDVRDGTHESPNFHKQGVAFVTSKNIVDGSLDLDSVSYITQKDAVSFDKRSKVDRDDILMSMIGTIGNSVLIDFEPEFCIKNVALIKPRRIDARYLIQLLSSTLFKNYLNNNLDGGIQKFVSLGTLRSLFVPAPLAPEQRVIAAVLSDVDALIAFLDKLIAKKRSIKQAAMQQLLTGKHRLAGFSGEWKTRTLGDEIERLEAGVSVNSVDEELQQCSHEKAILKTSCVLHGQFFPHESKTIAPRDLNRARLSPRADSIIVSRMNTPDLVGECGYVGKDYPDLYLPDRLWMMRFNRESRIIVRWLSYLLSDKEYKIKIKGVATGTSGSMKNIAKNSLLSIVIPFPAPEEQQAIATVLSDMDADIAALEARRDKTRALKHGMMQQLLTGNIRL